MSSSRLSAVSTSYATANIRCSPITALEYLKGVYPYYWIDVFPGQKTSDGRREILVTLTTSEAEGGDLSPDIRVLSDKLSELEEEGMK